MVTLRELNNCADVHGNKGSVRSYVLRVAAACVVLVGVAVAVHFIVTPFYHAGDAPFTLWRYMNWFIAAALLVTLGASYAGKRRMDGEGSAEIKRYLEVNTVFYGPVAASIIFFWNWFLELTPANVSDHQFWHALGAALPILMVVAGLRPWSMPKGRGLADCRARLSGKLSRRDLAICSRSCSRPPQTTNSARPNPEAPSALARCYLQ